MISEPWKGYLEPFRIFGNLYFVGTVPASSHLIDTGEGLILLDSGYQESLYLVLESIRKLGFDPKNIKYVLHTHGHIDHCGAARALKELYGCKLFMGERDKEYANGTLDLSYAAELGMTYIPFEPDVLIKDGDVITLGNTSVRAVATPGHTPGAMSYFFDVTDGKQTYRAGLHGGMGINTLSREFLDKYKLPYSYRDEFVNSMNRLQAEDVDIFLGNHAEHNDTVGKAERVRNGDTDAFVDPTEWKPYAQWCIENFEKMLKREQI